MFKRAEKFKIVEVAAPKPRLGPMSEDVRASIATLASHPGFQYLMDRFKLQRSVLQHHLVRDRHEAIRDVEFLQSGIAWLGWMEHQLADLVYKMQDTALPATDDEEALFREAMAAIETVGAEQD